MRIQWPIPCHASRAFSTSTRRCLADGRRFAESDYVLLTLTKDRLATPIFLGPLSAGKVLSTHNGSIKHDNIIGKASRDALETISSKQRANARYRLHEVRLEDYVIYSKRKVTPIYPHDANLIVSLFDIHPEVYDASNSDSATPQIEILEAGTGHGSLTLHLSRAIHAANGPTPKLTGVSEENEAAVRAWKASRRAVIHTIEISEQYSNHASKVVHGFRRGQYHGNVDFHAGDVSTWINQAMQERSGEPFLTHAFLDLPGTQSHVAATAAALKTDGTLIIFCPSITQINEVALHVRKNGIALELDRVVELGVNGGTGGRLWDVRLVRPRASLRANRPTEAEVDTDSASPEISDNEQPEASRLPEASENSAQAQEDNWALVCRPKVGDRITGGGFLAVFRKRSASDTRDGLETELTVKS